ncbi:MAG: single-stranded-DNA-specific exonuclease RecJ [Defluviicoccus sp.]
MPLAAEAQTADGADNTAFLGVACSLSGRRWHLRAADERAVTALVQQFALPDPIARMLAARGIGVGEAPGFLDPKLRSLLPDPHTLKDMAAGAERLAQAVMTGEAVTIFADYDVDGATAAAVLIRFLAAAGLQCRCYVPDRLKEGYGPNAAALLRLKAEGVSLVVTVDCGVNAHAALAEAEAAGLDVIVVDHHQGPLTLPAAVAVINPNRLDEDGRYGFLAAVGVAFLLAVAVNRLLRRAGWYASRPEPDLLALLDLVALGTVCDVVPLVGVNRAFVAQGLKIMARRDNVGLRALADVARLDGAPSAFDLGFVLGPRVNAGGRIGEPGHGARLLATGDAAEAEALARKLDAVNRERQQIEQAVIVEVLAAQAAEHDGSRPPLIWAAGADWHPGVVGIVASRLVERFHCPAFVLAVGTGRATGSCRSVAGFDIGAAIAAALQAGLLLRGGGHAMAAGFSLELARIDALRRFLSERVLACRGVRPADPVLTLDGVLTPSGASADLAAAMTAAAPFGNGNPEPRFALAAVGIDGCTRMGEHHLRCRLSEIGGGSVEAVAFRTVGTPLGAALLHHDGRPFHIAGRLSAKPWNGRQRIRFLIDDAAVAF